MNRLYLYIGVLMLVVGCAGASIVLVKPAHTAVQDTLLQVSSLNAQYTKVAVSQLIEDANRVYKRGSDVKGLLLLIQNTSTSTVELEARRQCQVSYKIFDASDKLLYDSAKVGACVNPERVTYFLPAGQTRLFDVVHKNSAYPLAEGVYRFELDYPGYGNGERTVTITQ